MKYYIFRTSLEDEKPNISELENLKVTYTEQLLLAKLNDKVNNFNKQVVPRVGRPAVMLTVSKQTVMKKECYY